MEVAEYPESKLSEDIIRASYYVANGYKMSKLKMESSELHDTFRDDICDLLNDRGIHCVAEKFFPKPLREAVFKGKKIRHFADLMIEDSVLIEIKVGTKDYLFSEENFLAFQGQCLETLEYSGLKLILLVRVLNDGNWKVDVKRFVL